MPLYQCDPIITDGSMTTLPTPHAEQARMLLRLRRLQDTLLGPNLFADPACDMLLDLSAADEEGVALKLLRSNCS